ncbi:hypothetical protein Tco_0938257 [Tanacetum coccineum]|uniref:Uncharacterized protein n=1 Tax=Tanacetum coccineum TaxID=301880 RepID=A0ABQ5DHJ1_9ASTR
MAESSSQILQQQDPHEQPETLPPFKPTPQVGLNMGEITFNPNNEVALLHPLHDNNKYFKLVSDITLKCCIKETFTKSPNQYKEYLSEFWYTTKALKNSKVWFLIPTRGIFGEVGDNTFRNAIGHSSDYVATPYLETVRQWFLTIGYGEAVEAKGTLKKSLLTTRWRLLMAKIIQCLGGKTGGFDQITNKDANILYCLANRVNIDFARLIWEDLITKLNKKTREKVIPYPRVAVEHKAPNTSFYTRKKDSKGKKPGAKSGHRKQPTSSKHHPLSKIEETKGGSSKASTRSKTSHFVKETHSNSVWRSFKPI